MIRYKVNLDGNLVRVKETAILKARHWHETEKEAWQVYRDKMIAKAQENIKQLGVLMGEVDKAQRKMDETT